MSQPRVEYLLPVGIYGMLLSFALFLRAVAACSGGLALYITIGVFTLPTLLMIPWFASTQRRPAAKCRLALLYFVMGLVAWSVGLIISNSLMCYFL